MNKRHLQRQVDKVRGSIKAKKIIKKLQDEILETPVLQSHHVAAARLLLDKAMPDNQQVDINHDVTITVEFQDAANTPSIEGLATEIHREPGAVQHSGDTQEGRQDISGDLLAPADDTDVH